MMLATPVRFFALVVKQENVLENCWQQVMILKFVRILLGPPKIGRVKNWATKKGIFIDHAHKTTYNAFAFWRTLNEILRKVGP